MLVSCCARLVLQIFFQDGGLLAGFPIEVFHVPRSKDIVCPTFGANLFENRPLRPTNNLVQLGLADGWTAASILEYQFVQKNPVRMGKG